MNINMISSSFFMPQRQQDLTEAMPPEVPLLQAKKETEKTSPPVAEAAKVAPSYVSDSMKMALFHLQEADRPAEPVKNKPRDAEVTVQKFMDYMNKTPEERLYEMFLKKEGLTKEQLAALPPEERAKIEEKIRKKIEEHIEKEAEEKVGEADSSSLDKTSQARIQAMPGEKDADLHEEASEGTTLVGASFIEDIQRESQETRDRDQDKGRF